MNKLNKCNVSCICFQKSGNHYLRTIVKVGKILDYVTGVFLAGLLLLLTIGLPVTFSSVQALKAKTTQSDNSSKNPYSNSTEEKTPNNNIGYNEEYVHNVHYDFHLPPSQIANVYIDTNEAIYVAYHGEMHCPPPNL